MNTEEYLNQLKGELKGFSAGESAVLVEEIRTHIEEGQEDAALGQGERRGQRLEEEMGSPHSLGRGFKEIYHPKRWVDFLLVFVPYEVLKYPILLVLLALFGGGSSDATPVFSDPLSMVQIRFTIALYALLVVIALRRRSLPVLFFWLPEVILTSSLLVFREKRWMASSFFYSTPACIVDS